MRQTSDRCLEQEKHKIRKRNDDYGFRQKKMCRMRQTSVYHTRYTIFVADEMFYRLSAITGRPGGSSG